MKKKRKKWTMDIEHAYHMIYFPIPFSISVEPTKCDKIRKPEYMAFENRKKMERNENAACKRSTVAIAFHLSHIYLVQRNLPQIYIIIKCVCAWLRLWWIKVSRLKSSASSNSFQFNHK